MKFDIEFENAILAQALRDEAFLKRAARICDAHHFGTREHAWLWGVIRSVWAEYRERTTAKIVLARARDEFKDDDKRKPYLVLAKRLFKLRPTGPSSALDELSKFVRFVNAQIALEQAADALEKGDIDACETAMSRASRDRARERNYTHIKWIEEFEERQAARKYEREHPGEFTTIPTGIKKLDEILTGGTRLGELNLIIATTGRGKSIGLSNIIHAAASRSYNAAYFALEMPARQIAMRQDARWSGLRYSQFKRYEFLPSESRALDARYRKAVKQFSNRLHIISMPIRSATLMDVRAVLDDLKDEHGFVPKMLIFDSGDHLRCSDKSMDTYRLQQADVYWGMKQLAEEDGYSIWSSTQAGKEWATRVAEAEATSESYDKGRIADLVVSLNDPSAGRRGRKTVEVEVDGDDDDDIEPEEVAGMSEPGPRRMELFVAKYRDGPSKLKIPLDCDFSRMRMTEVAGPDDD